MRFLIIKTSAFGDVIHAYPVLQYLKSRFPHAQIDWVIEKRAASLVKAHPLVDNAIEIDAKSWKKRWWRPKVFKEAYTFVQKLKEVEYDAVFDLQGNAKSAALTKLCRAKDKVGFGWKTASERINCCVTKCRSNPPRGQNVRRDYLFVVQNYFKDFSLIPEERILLKLNSSEDEILSEWKDKLSGQSWMICPGSHWENKKLGQETLEAFLSQCSLSFKPNYIFLAGSEAEKKEAVACASRFGPSAQVLDRPTLPLLQHLMKEMQVVIAMDSLPLHLAGTCGTATFSIFGPSVSYKFRPLGQQHFSFQGTCPYGEVFEKRCSQLRTCKTGACMKTMDPSQLFATFSYWWQSSAP